MLTNNSSFRSQSFWLNNGYIWFILPFIALPLLTRGVSILSSLSLLIALVLLIKHYRFVTEEIVKNRYLYLFLAPFIPVLISLIDALTPTLTVQTLWRMIRFSGYAIIALFVFQSHGARERFTAVLFWILMLYSLDAVIQWLFNYNIYGYNPVSNAWHNRVRGVFGERYDLGFFLATLSPLVFFYLFDKVKSGNRIYWVLTPLLLALFVVAILISGARTALISLAVSILLSVAYIIYQKKVTNYKLFGIGFILFLIVMILVGSQLDVVTARYLYTVKANSIDQMTSNRINLWNVAWSEFPNYWINGVGARGFDALYQTYPESYKMYKYVNHPHLQGLEVLIETGVVGFIAYLGACLYLLIAFFRSQQTNPWLLIALLTIMPINSFFGLYEGNWLPVIFISLAIACAFSRIPQSKYKA